MQPGHILVASITTPAWTPLFAMAAGIVTDIGGLLSHGSIVAREYGIPAVLGTGVATRRIHSGQIITVDGSSGTVIISLASKRAIPRQGLAPNSARFLAPAESGDSTASAAPKGDAMGQGRR